MNPPATAAAISHPSASMLPAELPARPSRWDRLGIVASLGCAVHCLAAPFLLLLLPSLGSVWSHPAAHWVLGALVLPLAVIVVWRGYRLHRKRLALVAMTLGVILIVVGLILPAWPANTDAHANANTNDTAPISAAAIHVDDAVGHESSSGAATACTDACCPTIVQDPDTGNLSMTLPPASLVTILGSVFLVLAHAVNLWGCRCFVAAADHAAGTCGCPAHPAPAV